MQLIHNIAPGAEICFYSGFSSEADMAHSMLALEAADCDSIVDDLIWLKEPSTRSAARCSSPSSR